MASQQNRRWQLRYESDLAIEASRLQHRRCTGELPGCEPSRFDLDFYLFALWRLREAARMVRDRIRDERINQPLAALDAALPNLKRLRDTLAHTDPDRKFVRNVVAFSDLIVRVRPGGDAEYLLELDRAQPAADALYVSLRDILGELPR